MFVNIMIFLFFCFDFLEYEKENENKKESFFVCCFVVINILYLNEVAVYIHKHKIKKRLREKLALSIITLINKLVVEHLF